jgi:hypothetical protein
MIGGFTSMGESMLFMVMNQEALIQPQVRVV